MNSPSIGHEGSKNCVLLSAETLSIFLHKERSAANSVVETSFTSHISDASTALVKSTPLNNDMLMTQCISLELMKLDNPKYEL